MDVRHSSAHVSRADAHARQGISAWETQSFDPNGAQPVIALDPIRMEHLEIDA
jgi:hypothetical protein